jgi:hypothetical protein
MCFCAFLWLTFDFVCVTPGARCGDAVLDFVAKAALVEVEQIV